MMVTASRGKLINILPSSGWFGTAKPFGGSSSEILGTLETESANFNIREKKFRIQLCTHMKVPNFRRLIENVRKSGSDFGTSTDAFDAQYLLIRIFLFFFLPLQVIGLDQIRLIVL